MGGTFSCPTHPTPSFPFHPAILKYNAHNSTGAILDEVPAEGSGLKFKGSAMVALASSKEEVLEQLKADIYAKNEVWDFSKVSYLAFFN